MILIPAKYAEIALGFDSIMLITALLFRKPKGLKERQTLDRKFIRLIGYYLTVSAVLVLFVAHLSVYLNLWEYLLGLGVDAFTFYLGLRCLYV
ncbi:hypothetical protein [Sulfolobus spindle-shaped virus]|nr:hypothetical protein [Sulfolobus spindle-shaped virus]